MKSLPRASVAELAYIAGYTDGEGCLGWYGSSPIIAYESCHPKPIRMIASIFGAKVRTRTRTGKGQTKRTVFMLKYHGDNCILILKMITPYLIEKHDQADSILQMKLLKDKLKNAKRKNHN